MTKQDYDNIYRLIDKLRTEAPCHNRACVSHINCDYRINSYDREECALTVILTEVAQYRYREWKEKQST